MTLNDYGSNTLVSLISTPNAGGIAMRRVPWRLPAVAMAGALSVTPKGIGCEVKMVANSVHGPCGDFYWRIFGSNKGN